MKALTLHQPWATLIASGVKTSETRSWPPPKALYGQRIAIHAGRKEIARRDIHLLRGIAERLPWFRPNDPTSVVRISIPTGGVVATARLVTAFRVGEHSEDGRFALCDRQHDDLCPSLYHTARIDQYGDYSIGRWIWVLDRVEEYDPPVAAVGHQGIWNWEAPQ